MPIRVATLNIWNRMGPWEERLTAIRQQLAELKPDILGLQEVVKLEGFDQGELIGADLGYHVAYGRHPEGPHPMGNAILSQWPIVRSEAFPLPRMDTDEHRSLVFAEIASPHGPLHVYCTHLNWKLHESHVRQAQIHFVAEVMQRLSPAADPHVFPAFLLGDMNAEPDSDEIRFLRGLCAIQGRSIYLADTFGLTAATPPRSAPGYTFSRENAFAAPLREPNRRIDYVFVRGPDERGRGEPLDARVCFDTPVSDVFPSDHFGVVASISTE